MNAEKPSSFNTLETKCTATARAKWRVLSNYKHDVCNCPINAQIRLLIANRVREFCYSFDYPSNRLTETCSLGLPFTSLILDIHVMINWHLSKQGICWPVSRDHIAGSNVQLIEVACFFEVDRWPSTGFSIGSRAHVMLTCWKPGRIVRKPANGSPGLKFFWIVTFLLYECFLLLCFEYTVIINVKTESQIVSRKPHPKLQNSNQHSTFPWVSSNGHWTTRPRSYAFRLALIYILLCLRLIIGYLGGPYIS